MTKPFNNNVLIEVTKEYASVSRSDENETLKSGVVISYSLSPVHLTASSSIIFGDGTIEKLTKMLDAIVGKTVRWEEFAEGGQTFDEDGKTYASLPFWRLITVGE